MQSIAEFLTEEAILEIAAGANRETYSLEYNEKYFFMIWGAT